MESRVSRIVSFVVLIAIIAVFGMLFYRVMSVFFLPLFLAALLVVIFRPIHRWMLIKCKGRQRLAAGLTTASILLMVLVPLGWILSLGVFEGAQLVAGLNDAKPVARLEKLRSRTGLDKPHAWLLQLIDIRLSSIKELASSTEIRREDLESTVGEELLRLQQLVSVFSELVIGDYRYHRLMHEVLPQSLKQKPIEIESKRNLEEARLKRAGLEATTAQLIDKSEKLAELNQQFTEVLRDEYVLQYFSQNAELDDDELQRILEEAQGIDVAAPDAFERIVVLLSGVRLPIDTGDATETPDDARPLLRRLVQRKWRFNSEDRQAMLSPIEELIAFVDRKLPISLRELGIGIQRIEIAFQLRRQQLLGGGAISWLVELANPSATEFQNWQAQFVSYFRQWILSVSGTTTARFGGLVLGLAVMTISMFYFLSEGPALIDAVMRLSPLDDKYERELFVEFDQVSRAVVIATLLSAIVQGLLAGVGFYFAGMSSGFLLTILTMVFAMIPFVGAAAIWVPVSLWLAFVDERVFAGIMLAIYGMCIVSMADNVIKPLVLHGQSKLHPLLALLSVLGGVQALGPIGILVGPMVVSFLQALLNMLHVEIMALESAGKVKNASS